MNLLEIDIGSSSVKASVIDAQTEAYLASSFVPKQEIENQALKSDWVEQYPDLMWQNLNLL